MATSSFNKSFQISNQKTIDKLEVAAQNITPIKVDAGEVIKYRGIYERKLLSIIRSKL